MGIAFDELKRFNGWSGLPKDFIIVGIDRPGEKGDPGYDAESNAMPINMGLVKIMDMVGFIGAIEISKIGGEPIVMNGRTRVRAARHINQEGATKGIKKPMRIKAVLYSPSSRGGRDRNLEMMMASLAMNEGGRQSDVQSKVAIAAELNKMGASNEQIAAVFHVVPEAVRTWLQVREASPIVQESFDRGELPFNAVRALRDIPEPDQNQIVADLRVDEVKVTVPEVKKRIAEKVGKNNPKKQKLRRGKRELLALKDAAAESYVFSQNCGLDVATERSLCDTFISGVEWAVGVLSDTDIGLDPKAASEPPSPTAPVKRRGAESKDNGADSPAVPKEWTDQVAKSQGQVGTLGSDVE
jgi:hypothetical protein